MTTERRPALREASRPWRRPSTRRRKRYNRDGEHLPDLEGYSRKTMMASIAAALVLAGCGGAHAASSGMRSSPQGPAPLTANHGAAICNDLKAWLAQAVNQGAPRFSPQLTTDENKAL